MTPEQRHEVEKLYHNMIPEVDLDSAEGIINQAMEYKEYLVSREPGERVIQGLQLLDILSNIYPTLEKPINQKTLIAALEYFIEEWDIIPDVNLQTGLIDDIHVLRLCIDELKENKEKQKNFKKLRLNSQTILDDLGYSVKHILAISKQRHIYTPEQRNFLLKIANIHRAAKPINNKEKVYFTMLIEKYLDEFGKTYICSSGCGDCYKIKKYFRNQLSDS